MRYLYNRSLIPRPVSYFVRPQRLVRGKRLADYCHFYIERRGPDGWGLPPGFQPEPWTFESERPFGEFAWAHPRNKWLTLFWGAGALFPMRPGPPDDQRGSVVLQDLGRFFNVSCDESGLSWLPYPDLLIDCWDADSVTLVACVPARYALLFGDGRQAFPAAALLEEGLSEQQLERLRDGWLAREPVDTTFGRARFRVAELPPDREVEVTWRATIAEFVGEPHAGLFNGLRQFGPDESLRILSMR